MIFGRTSSVKKGEDTYTNNLTKTIITKNGEKISDYCILAVEGNIVTIKQAGMVTQVSLESSPYKDIIELFIEEKKQPKREVQKKKPNKKSSKSTIKGKQQKKEEEVVKKE